MLLAKPGIVWRPESTKNIVLSVISKVGGSFLPRTLMKNLLRVDILPPSTREELAPVEDGRPGDASGVPRAVAPLEAGAGKGGQPLAAAGGFATGASPAPHSDCHPG